MASETRLTQWLVNNRQALGLKLRELDWSKHWQQKIFDFEAEMTVQGKVVVGRGTDQNELLAVEKACAEAIERGICTNFGISSKGIAIHTDPQSARDNSAQEAAERAIFDWHLRTRSAFTPVPHSRLKNLPAPLICNETTTIRFFEMSAINSYDSLICLIGESDRQFLGLASSKGIDGSAYKALIEAMRNLLAYREEPPNFLKSVQSNPDLWCADMEFFTKISELFTKPPGELLVPPRIEIATELIDLKNIAWLVGCPAIAARSIEKGTSR
jgi:hypothetical protein